MIRKSLLYEVQSCALESEESDNKQKAINYNFSPHLVHLTVAGFRNSNRTSSSTPIIIATYRLSPTHYQQS